MGTKAGDKLILLVSGEDLIQVMSWLLLALKQELRQATLGLQLVLNQAIGGLQLALNQTTLRLE